MALTKLTMTDEQRKSVALEYLKAFDNGGVTSSSARGPATGSIRMDRGGPGYPSGRRDVGATSLRSATGSSSVVSSIWTPTTRARTWPGIRGCISARDTATLSKNGHALRSGGLEHTCYYLCRLSASDAIVCMVLR